MAKLNRPNAEPIDLEELRTAGPDEALGLFSEETQAALRGLDSAVVDEVGTLLAALGDVVARSEPPAIRLDIRVGERWEGEVLIAGRRTWGKTGGNLSRLLAGMVYEVVEQALEDASADGRDAVTKAYMTAMADLSRRLQALHHFREVELHTCEHCNRLGWVCSPSTHEAMVCPGCHDAARHGEAYTGNIGALYYYPPYDPNEPTE
jgi:hypothetical protein